MFRKKKEYLINVYKAPLKEQGYTYTKYNWDATLDGILIGTGYNFSVKATKAEAEEACREYSNLGKYTYRA